MCYSRPLKSEEQLRTARDKTFKNVMNLNAENGKNRLLSISRPHYLSLTSHSDTRVKYLAEINQSSVTIKPCIGKVQDKYIFIFIQLIQKIFFVCDRNDILDLIWLTKGFPFNFVK